MKKMKWPNKSKQLRNYSLVMLSLLVYACNSSADKSENATDSTATAATNSKTDPLPSWNEGDVKKSLIDYVSGAAANGGAGFIPASERIAVFDNDGTLWAEQPLYFQFFYCIERVRELASQHPEWKNKEPFKSVLSGDIKGALASGEKGLITLMGASLAGVTGKAYEKSVNEWASKATNPVTKKKFLDMVYQPMQELLAYMRANGFQTYIVSGGDRDFMRAWSQATYGIPPNQVVGSSLKVSYEEKNDTADIMRMPVFNFLDDGAGKPVGIYEHIGQKPVFAAGNSDGDYQMLQWTALGAGKHMEIIVHHTDSVREWAYDRQSKIGTLNKALDSASRFGWILIDMKRDWKKIFPYNQ
jgi:phosphoglycolate phosphatase-like HAD superfamily hydrolase